MIIPTICLIAAAFQPQNIHCDATLYGPHGDALASPSIDTPAGERAEVRVGDEHEHPHIRFEVTPSLWRGGVIHNDVRIRISDHWGHHEEGEDSSNSHTTDCRLHFTMPPGETERIVFGEKGVKYLHDGDDHPRLRGGEFELDLTESIQ